LFDLRLTHEELVQAQSELLRTIESLDVVNQEVKRLESVTSNAIAGKTLLERKYEQQKSEAVLRAQRQTLLLHGLSEKQVSDILETRTLLRDVQVQVPADHEQQTNDTAPVYLVQSLHVERGQHVKAGDRLLTLANHADLFIAGNAFEKDA